MSDLVATTNPVALALLGTLFTWFMTALGSSLVLFFKTIKPWILDSLPGAAGAGAMIYVVVEEVIPESQRGENAHLATMGVILGFTVMMALDVLLG